MTILFSTASDGGRVTATRRKIIKHYVRFPHRLGCPRCRKDSRDFNPYALERSLSDFDGGRVDVEKKNRL